MKRVYSILFFLSFFFLYFFSFQTHSHLLFAASPQGLPCGANGGTPDKCTEIDTALGPIPTNPAGFVGRIFSIVLSFSGGVAMLLIIWGGYKLTISRGNPEKIQEARERITSAIIGLLFIIFSMVLLQIIGVDILHLPKDIISK